jgi:hypothetical protein
MSWLFSQALVEEYLGGCSSDGEQFAPSNLTNTPAMFLSQGKMTEALNLSRFGMMCEPLTESLGAELLMSFLEAFHAKTFHAPETVQESVEKEVVYGNKCYESLARYDQNTHSLRTHQYSLLEDCTSLLQTLPGWGTIVDGELSELPMLERYTSAKEYGLSVPTPCKSDGSRQLMVQIKVKHLRKSKFGARVHSLPYWLLKNHNLRCSPKISEWVMGWPLGWSSLQPLAMVKYQQWLQKHGMSCAKNQEPPQGTMETGQNIGQQAKGEMAGRQVELEL